MASSFSPHIYLQIFTSLLKPPQVQYLPTHLQSFPISLPTPKFHLFLLYFLNLHFFLLLSPLPLSSFINLIDRSALVLLYSHLLDHSWVFLVGTLFFSWPWYSVPWAFSSFDTCSRERTPFISWLKRQHLCYMLRISRLIICSPNLSCALNTCISNCQLAILLNVSLNMPKTYFLLTLLVS